MTEHSGLALDGQWDLYVDSVSGDLAVESAIDEVKKDLALTVGRALDGEVGNVMDDGRLSDIEIYTRKLLLSDPRVDAIEQADASVPSNDPDRMVLDITVLLGTYTRIVEEDTDGDGDLEEVELEIAFNDGSVVRTEVL